MYPWGGMYTRNYKGCFLAISNHSAKLCRRRWRNDNESGFFEPNEWGLYDMAGNVAEWTANAYDESAYIFTHDLNPDYKYNAKPDDPPSMKRKVIRGGSWKDIAYYLQCGTRSYEYQIRPNRTSFPLCENVSRQQQITLMKNNCKFNTMAFSLTDLVSQPAGKILWPSSTVSELRW
jgi:formylglycine-generating enzyme required for sulfatase activity